MGDREITEVFDNHEVTLINIKIVTIRKLCNDK